MIANPDEATPVNVIFVELNGCVPGFGNVIVWLDWPETLSVNDCGTALDPVAVNVMLYGPPAPRLGIVVSVPVPATPGAKKTPVGSVPAAIVCWVSCRCYSK